MFGVGDSEDFESQIERLKRQAVLDNQSCEQRVARLVDILGDLDMQLDAGFDNLEWEGTQAKYDAKGFELGLMKTSKSLRDVCLGARDRVQQALIALGYNPREVGTQARTRREADEKLARAQALRAEAARLEAEVSRR